MWMYTYIWKVFNATNIKQTTSLNLNKLVNVLHTEGSTSFDTEHTQLPLELSIETPTTVQITTKKLLSLESV